MGNTFNIYVSKKNRKYMDQLKVIADSQGIPLSQALFEAVGRSLDSDE